MMDLRITEWTVLKKKMDHMKQREEHEVKRRDGFADQVLILIPPELYSSPGGLVSELCITDIGYFPKASGHLVERSSGAPSWIFVLCLKGSGWLHTNEVDCTIHRHEAFIIPAGTAHSYGSAEHESWELLWVHFTGNAAAAAAASLCGTPFTAPIHLEPGAESIELFSTMCSSLQEGITPWSYELACSRLWHLFGTLVTDRRMGTPSSCGIVEHSKRIMENRISGSLSLTELCTAMRVSPQYLCRVFTEITGHAPMEHYTRLKIQRACALLDLTTQRIGEISVQVGYDDQFYFSRVFRKIMGISPRSYRLRQK
jgi:AraC family transcriptional regulator, arabinose operon regulatory protein